MYRLTGGRLPLIGVGGIASASDAYAKIRAGASVVQLHTALIYKGLDVVTHLKEGLVTSLQADGFKNISEAVGSAHTHSRMSKDSRQSFLRANFPKAIQTAYPIPG